MHDYNQNQGFPITVTFLTKSRTLYKEKINSKTSFNSLLEKFKNNSQYHSQAKLKNKYIINGKQIRNNQTLEEIIFQNMCDPNNSELYLELNDILYSGDTYINEYKKIIQPKENPFGLFIYSTREGMLSLHNFEEKTINLFELEKIDEGSAYCNSNEDFYISGNNGKDNKNFWIINNNDFNIKKKNMPFGKKNHSMIYLTFNENEEWIFITGGNDKKSFYYDLNKNYFINWSDTLDIHQNPTLIRIGEYLYILDTLNSKKNYWERTKIISPTRKWEKVIPKLDKKLLSNFPSEFAVSYDTNSHIVFIGGNNILNSNSTYVYDPISNEIYLSKIGTNDNEIFSDKIFYKINNKYNVAIPKNVTEKKEICLVNKDEQALIKLSIDIPNENRKTKIKTRINFDDKKFLDKKNDEGTITIKELDIKGKNNILKNNYMNQRIQPKYICQNCAMNNNSICQICHRSFKKDNYMDNNQKKRNNPTLRNPYIEKIHDTYYPTLEKRYERTYGNYKDNSKVRVEVIYDEYTPIKVNYELGKPYKYKYVKPNKIEESKNIKEKSENIKGEININNEHDANIKNDINVNFVKEDNKENKQQIEETNVQLNVPKEKEIINNSQKHQENVENENEGNVKEDEQQNEVHVENQMEEKKEEYKDQILDGHNYYKHYGQKRTDDIKQNEIFRDSLEVNEIKIENDLIKNNNQSIDNDDEILKPALKLDFGFQDDYEEKSDTDFDIIKGLKLNFDNDNKNNVNTHINIEKTNEIIDNQENIIINGEEENQNIEHNNEEEEIHYENHENEENDNPLEEGGEFNNEQGKEEINFEEDGEKMQYEEQEENVIENEEEQHDVIEIGQEDENENEENYINEEHEEEH